MNPILISGADIIGSAIALTLSDCGFPVLVIADPAAHPLRYNLALADTLALGKKMVHGLSATTVMPEMLEANSSVTYPQQFQQAVRHIIANREIPVVDPVAYADFLGSLDYQAVIRCDRADFGLEVAGLVLGLGSLHQPGSDCHVVIEDRMVYQLGSSHISTNTRVTEANSSQFFHQPLQQCSAPAAGTWISSKSIGDAVRVNEEIGRIGDASLNAPIDGQIWGLLHSGVIVESGTAAALIFQGYSETAFQQYSFRERVIAGAVLQQVVRHLKRV